MTIQRAVSLKDRNTFGFDVRAEYFAQVDSWDDVNDAISWSGKKSLPVFVLGGGSNLVLTRDIEGLVLAVETRGIEVVNEDSSSITLQIAAGENWHQFVMYCCEHGYHGVENLALIPGNVGAAPIQNIGAYGVELCDVFESLDAISLSDGLTHTFSRADCQFAYRDSAFKRAAKTGFLISQVRLKLNKIFAPNLEYGALQNAMHEHGIDRPNAQQLVDLVCAIRQSKLPNPAEIGNAGSFFTNPIVSPETHEVLKTKHPQLVSFPDGERFKLAAAWLIERCGWKGHRENGVGVHDKQALVLVNQKGGDGQSLIALADKIVCSVSETFGVELEIEPLVV
ncbi:MAG: UDP-N-acetylmuramate dehydrogenase [Pseudomonadota bacterium]